MIFKVVYRFPLPRMITCPRGVRSTVPVKFFKRTAFPAGFFWPLRNFFRAEVTRFAVLFLRFAGFVLRLRHPFRAARRLAAFVGFAIAFIYRSLPLELCTTRRRILIAHPAIGKSNPDSA